MPPEERDLIFEFFLIVLAIAVVFDLVFGEPPEFLHPVVYFGKVINYLDPRVRRLGSGIASGVVFVIIIVIAGLLPLLIILTAARLFLILDIFVSAYILKSTFAIRSMYEHINKVIGPLELGNLEEARKELSMIVRRPVDTLSEGTICSACVESLSEGLVDGFIGPLFYFPIFGIPGSIVYRIVNTLDSNVGYKDSRNIRFGKPSAILDTVLNYIPARLASGVLTISASLLALRGFIPHYSDIAATESPNAGWPMSTAASFLNVKLEKEGHYIINEGHNFPTVADVRASMRLYGVSCLIFILVWILPVLALRTVL
ncbi:cobalamin biosynthesis protein [Thermoplasmatales archaeon AK]|nr:cobalamin biosynthesis protein [Thermoplasmatales archaeon AK]